jgi:hypothetical protein
MRLTPWRMIAAASVAVCVFVFAGLAIASTVPSPSPGVYGSPAPSASTTTPVVTAPAVTVATSHVLAGGKVVTVVGPANVSPNGADTLYIVTGGQKAQLPVSGVAESGYEDDAWQPRQVTFVHAGSSAPMVTSLSQVQAALSRGAAYSVPVRVPPLTYLTSSGGGHVDEQHFK